MAQPKPVRRRIVPEQIISPNRNQAVVPEPEAPGANHQQDKIELGDLKEHSELASTLLGPGRKLYVDLASYQKQGKAIDWKELLTAQQVQSGGGDGDDKRPEVGQDDNRAGEMGKEVEKGRLDSPGAPRNPLAAVIRRLERTIGMARFGEEEEDNNNDLDGQDSGAEAEVDGGEGEGEEQDIIKEASQRPKSSSTTRKKNEYNYIDDWIDDSEFIEMIEHTDRRKLKYEGFFIAKGDVERLEELVPEAIPDKATSKDPNRTKKKRQRGPEMEEEGQGARGGQEAGQKESKKKKTTGGKKKTQNSVGQAEATQDGVTNSHPPSSRPPDATVPAVPAVPAPTTTPSKQGAADSRSGQTPKEAKVKASYIIPPHVNDIIKEMRTVAATLPSLPPSLPPAEGETKVRKTKKLPSEILTLLKAAESAFHKEVDDHGSMATKKIVDELMSFLEPYSTRENMRLYVSRRPGRSNTKSATASLSEAIAQHYQTLSSASASASADPGPASGPQQLSEELQKKLVAFIQAKLNQTKAAGLPEAADNPEALSAVPPPIVKEVADLFPPNIIAEITPGFLSALLDKWGKKEQPTPSGVHVTASTGNGNGSLGPEVSNQDAQPQPLAARAIAAALAAAQNP